MGKHVHEGGKEKEGPDGGGKGRFGDEGNLTSAKTGGKGIPKNQ